MYICVFYSIRVSTFTGCCVCMLLQQWLCRRQILSQRGAAIEETSKREEEPERGEGGAEDRGRGKRKRKRE